MQGKINKSAVEKLQPGEFLADTEVRGFMARCLPSRTVTFGFKYRADGKQRWEALGTHGQVTAEQARKKAKAAQGKVAVGQDPMGEKRQARADAGITVNAMLDEFLQRHAKKLRSADLYERTFEIDVRPAIGTKSVYDVKLSDIVKLLDGIEDRGSPVKADLVLALTRKAFNWRMERDDRLLRNPTKGIKPRTDPVERARKRILSDEEIRDLWATLDQVKGVPACYPAFVKVCFLAVRRRCEVAGMTWEELGADGIWTIPSARHKTGKKAGDMHMPLTPKILALLGERGTGHVFTANGKVAFGGFGEPLDALRRAMNALRKAEGRPEVERFTLHDLRRTGRSLMSRAGVWPDHAELCLGHALKGVRATYDRHSYAAEKRLAFEKLGAMIETILSPPPANVVPLHPHRIGEAA